MSYSNVLNYSTQERCLKPNGALVFLAVQVVRLALDAIAFAAVDVAALVVDAAALVVDSAADFPLLCLCMRTADFDLTASHEWKYRRTYYPSAPRFRAHLHRRKLPQLQDSLLGYLRTT